MTESIECRKCGKDKEPGRIRSVLCRACDASARARRTTGVRTAHKRLTLDLPVDVWDRLDVEAQASGMRIAGHVAHLIIKRDAKLNP